MCAAILLQKRLRLWAVPGIFSAAQFTECFSLLKFYTIKKKSRCPLSYV